MLADVVEFKTLQHHLVAAYKVCPEVAAVSAEQPVRRSIGFFATLAATNDNLRKLDLEFRVLSDRARRGYWVCIAQQVRLDTRQRPDLYDDASDRTRVVFAGDPLASVEVGVVTMQPSDEE